jgi:hypothetical protein
MQLAFTLYSKSLKSTTKLFNFFNIFKEIFYFFIQTKNSYKQLLEAIIT